MSESLIEILRVGIKGQGVGGDSDGNVYFVERALPGDQVRVSFPSSSRRYRDALLVELVRPSAGRIAPVCPYFQECGGCDWLNWDYNAQLAAKDALVGHALARVGLIAKKTTPIRGAGKTLGYRTRVQLRYESGKLGFYRRHSHDLIDIERCAVAHPKINEFITEWSGKEFPGSRGKVEVGVSSSGSVFSDWNKDHASRGFTQVNEEQNDYLKRRVAECLKGSRNVLELFCGDGNLTASYWSQSEEVIAVEGSGGAVERANGRGFTGVSFLRDTVDRGLLKRLPADFLDRCDTLLMDPPRQGLRTPIAGLVPKSVRSLVYVSCAPGELAKDGTRLKDMGFELDELECIDMFPQTRHVETLAVFRRSLLN